MKQEAKSVSYASGPVKSMVHYILVRQQNKFWVQTRGFLPKDVLPNINNTQATKGLKNPVFCPWWPRPLTFKLVQVRDQTRLPCVSGTNLLQLPRYFIHKQKTTDWGRQKTTLRSSLRVVNTKALPSEECVAKHKLVVMDMWMNKWKRCHKKFETKAVVIETEGEKYTRNTWIWS